MGKIQTNSIRYASALTAFYAARFARDQDRHLNTLVTLNFTTLGITDDDAVEFFRQVKARAATWWRYRREKTKSPFYNIGPFDWVMVHANPRGSAHVHWVIRVPQGHQAEFDAMLVNRIKKLAGLEDLKTALNIKPIPKKGVGGVMKYCLRGVNPNDGPRFFLRAANEGTVIGRRVGVSRSLGHSARERANWRKVGAKKDSRKQSQAR